MPADLTVGQFVYVIRKRIKLSPEKAIFIFVDEVLPPTAALMSSIYEEHKDEDGFLYITYAQSCFGLSVKCTEANSNAITDTPARTLSASLCKQYRAADHGIIYDGGVLVTGKGKRLVEAEVTL